MTLVDIEEGTIWTYCCCLDIGSRLGLGDRAAFVG